MRFPIARETYQHVSSGLCRRMHRLTWKSRDRGFPPLGASAGSCEGRRVCWGARGWRGFAGLWGVYVLLLIYI